MSIYYTVKGKRDGFGAQYQAIMSGIAYCESDENLVYVHSPFMYISHLPRHPLSIREMNDFIGIPPSPQVPQAEQKTIQVEPFSHWVHNSTEPDLFYTAAVRQRLRDYYLSTWKPELLVVPEIAVHIRRGDVTPQIKTRFVPNEVYQKVLLWLRTQYPTSRITLYSEGHAKDFEDLLALGPIQLVLNGDIRTTFHSLVTAKILVTSKSSFSYAAALLQKNTVYYMPFWHHPLSFWKSFPPAILQVRGTVPETRPGSVDGDGPVSDPWCAETRPERPGKDHVDQIEERPIHHR